MEQLTNSNDCTKKEGILFRHKITALILTIFIFIIIGTACGSSSTSFVNTSIPLADYKTQCVSMTYDTLAREPDKYIDKMVKFTGEIIQIQEDGNNVVMRINITKGKYDIYKDTIWVNYKYADGEKKLLEDDIVNIWGELKGTVTYKSIMGAEITIPQMNARCIEFVKKYTY